MAKYPRIVITPDGDEDEVAVPKCDCVYSDRQGPLGGCCARCGGALLDESEIPPQVLRTARSIVERGGTGLTVRAVLAQGGNRVFARDAQQYAEECLLKKDEDS